MKFWIPNPSKIVKQFKKTPLVLQKAKTKKKTFRKIHTFLCFCWLFTVIFVRLWLSPLFIESPRLFSSQLFPINSFTVYQVPMSQLCSKYFVQMTLIQISQMGKMSLKETITFPKSQNKVRVKQQKCDGLSLWRKDCHSNFLED